MKFYNTILTLLLTCGSGVAPPLHSKSANLRAVSNSSLTRQHFLASDLHAVAWGTGRQGSERSDSLTCGQTVYVSKDDDPLARCPAQCPFFVQDKTDDQYCTMACVGASECTAFNPATPIADEERGICRSPLVPNCASHVYDGTDTCRMCISGYDLHDGVCYFKYMWAIYLFAAVLLLVVLFVAAWVVDLSLRPTTNKAEVVRALKNRDREKLHTRTSRKLKFWSLLTNLTSDARVGGAGLMLHFNFMFCVILWALAMAVCWAITGHMTDPVVLELGTRPFGTPRQNCILVAWGYTTQHETMWIKVYFLIGAYICTFGVCILYAFVQRYKFLNVDRTEKTMSDFCALISHLPVLSGRVEGGNRCAEKELKTAIENRIWPDDTAEGTRVRPVKSERIVGISICWDYGKDKEAVDAVLRKRLVEMDGAQKAEESSRRNSIEAEMSDSQVSVASVADPDASNPEKMGKFRGTCYKLEGAIFGNSEALDQDIHVEQILNGMTSSAHAFCVFASEELRNEAVDRAKRSPVVFRDHQLELLPSECEPDSVSWENWGYLSSPGHKAWAVFRGIGIVVLALSAWTVFFYAPYAWSIFNFQYDDGREPGFVYGMSFTLVVCVGNTIMYQVAAMVSDSIGFRYRDDREGCYMLIYSVACLSQYLLDAVCTYYTAEQVMMGLGLRVYDGRRLNEIDTFVEKFETYALQRRLAQNMYEYAWPSTFLIPFIIEPFATILLPQVLGVLILRCHPEIKGIYAEELLASAPLDLGRYADIIFNIMLGVLIFYFPGGYTIRLFCFMALAHTFIYGMDQWRILRVVPKFHFSSYRIDEFAQMMLAPCTGLILSSLVFKANCAGFGWCVEGFGVIFWPTLAFVLHCFVHTWVVGLVPKWFNPFSEDTAEDGHHVMYEEIAAQEPRGWFSTNPIHCLRSQVLHQDSPPCGYCWNGKEHLLQVNPKIGLYFESTLAEADAASLSRIFTSRLSDLVTPGQSKGQSKNASRRPSHPSAQ